MKRKSRFSKEKQRKLIEHFVAGRRARYASSLVGVNFKSARYYFQRFREIIPLQLKLESPEVFGGEIEVDESSFRGHMKGNRGGAKLWWQSSRIWGV